MQLFSRDLGIDLGTSNILIYKDGTGITTREPSVVAVSKASGKILQVGASARNMLGRTPGNLVAMHPLKDGVISDHEMTVQMLQHLFRTTSRASLFTPKPRVVVSVPSGITEVEERSVINAALEAGARRVYLIEEPLAAAIGANLDIGGPNGHMVVDIGGGTSNLALIEDGRIMSTGCLNIGGRLLKIAPDGRLTYVSPVLSGIFPKFGGDYVNRKDIRQLASTLAEVLEMAAGLREPSPLLQKLTTVGTRLPEIHGNVTLSFSGGVADCIREDHPFLSFGDLGPELGLAIRESRLCQNPYLLEPEAIRATVIGAGCHSAQLSGSTVFHQNVGFPLKNLPVAESMERLNQLDSPGVLVVTGEALDFSGIRDLAKQLADTVSPPVYVAASGDMAKALGVQLALKLGDRAEILCIDRVILREGDFLDVGAPVGPALPVVVKTLILGQ